MTPDSTSASGVPQADVAPFNAAGVAASLTVKDIRKSLFRLRDPDGFKLVISS